LLVGVSHLRSVADGIVPMPVGGLAFGVMSTPGACADLRLEVSQAVLPREPDAVCVMAPSNNLTDSRTVEEAGDVFCTTRIPHSVGSCERQDLFQQQYHRRSAKLGLSYVPIHNDLPRYRRELWCPDGIHLSDNHGMPILTQLMWNASYQFLETHAPKPLVQHQVSRPLKASVVPHVVVKGVERIPPPHPSEWTFVRPSGRRNHSGEFEKASNSPKKRVVLSETDDTSVALKECFIPLNPVRFSTSILAAMDTLAPLALGDVPTDIQTMSVGHRKKPAVLKPRPVKQLVNNCLIY
uniref:TeximYa n=1 Tax=Nothobranchius furzeri TaxID=105023 RepID=A0A8C6LU94_NOTFU